MPCISFGLSMLASRNMSLPHPCESSMNFSTPFLWLFPWPLVGSSHGMYRATLSDRIGGFPEILQSRLSPELFTPLFYSDLPNLVSLTSPKFDLYL